MVAGVLAAAGGVAALQAGPLPLAVFATAVYVFAFVELRRILARGAGSAPSLVLGAAAVGALSWLAYDHRLQDLPLAVAALLLGALVVRILAVEFGVAKPDGATADVAATVTAAGVVGLLGAHLFLIRAVPDYGYRGVVVLGLMVFGNKAVDLAVTRLWPRDPVDPRPGAGRWPGMLAGAGTSVVVGLVAGLVLRPPFTPVSGLVVGAAVAVLAGVGELADRALRRSGGLREAAEQAPAGAFVLEGIDGLLFSAPLFYWAFRTLVI